MSSRKSRALKKVNYRIGELLLFVSQRKKVGAEKYSEKEYERTAEELEEICTALGNLMKRKQ